MATIEPVAESAPEPVQNRGQFPPGNNANPKGRRSEKERRILAAAEAADELEALTAEFVDTYGRAPKRIEAIVLEQCASLTIDIRYRSKRGLDVSDARRLLLRASGQLPKPPPAPRSQPVKVSPVDASVDEDVSDEALLSRAQLIEEEMSAWDGWQRYATEFAA
jgi:hypothetical protein